MAGARKRFMQKAKGTSDRVQIKPREQAPVIGTATVISVDAWQNTCDLQLAEGVIVPKVRCIYGYQPKVGDTAKTVLVHPALYATSQLLVVDPYIPVA